MITFQLDVSEPSLSAVDTDAPGAAMVRVLWSTPLMYVLTRTSGATAFAWSARTNTRNNASRPLTRGTDPPYACVLCTRYSRSMWRLTVPAGGVETARLYAPVVPGRKLLAQMMYVPAGNVPSIRAFVPPAPSSSDATVLLLASRMKRNASNAALVMSIRSAVVVVRVISHRSAYEPSDKRQSAPVNSPLTVWGLLMGVDRLQ